MSMTDIEYFRDRAAVERALTLAASDSRAAAAHLALARGYDALVRKEERRGAILLVTPDWEQRTATA